MKHKIIVDSCCDLTQELKEELVITTVPLTMRLGSKEFLDDDSLDKDDFIAQMKLCSEKVGSASPPPILYEEALEDAETAYIVTLSSQLSGSYASAVMSQLAFLEDETREVHVLDSKSGSAGETLVAIKLHQLLQEGKPTEQIVSTIKKFIDSMKTYFVLENYDNLQKNGRMSKVKGKLVQVLNLKLIMGTDGNGNIALFEKAKGVKKMLSQMLALIEKSGKNTAGESLVISHCNNPEMAERLSSEVKRQFQFEDIFIVPTSGLSSMYADDKGIVMAF